MLVEAGDQSRLYFFACGKIQFMKRSLHSISIVVTLASLLLSACGLAATPTLAPTQTALSPTVTPIPSPTPVPERNLVVCLAEEPKSLYLYGSSTRSTWDVLEALYDGPLDTSKFNAQPVILQKLPSLKDGDAQINPVDVRAGDPVVDIQGNLLALAKGVTVLPSGCSSRDCAAAWDGKTALKMDQLSASFKLLPDVKWSDGSTLTADDSVFSYTIAADPATPASKTVVDRTASYKAVDSTTVQWVGVPGFVDARYNTYFWPPLPQKALKGKSAADLLQDEQVTRQPMGWGPYMLKEWTAGDHIRLVKNPNYFRAGEGLPKFDNLVFRFLGSPADSALLALVSKECDIVDQNPDFQPHLQEIINTQTNGKLKLYTGVGPEWEHLDFGIRPASWDNPSARPANARPDIFADVRTRQAVATCIDRDGIAKNLFFGRSQVPDGYTPPDSPLFQKELTAYTYDPAAAQKLLDEAGWKDSDKKPETPRVSVGVKGVPDGTPLNVTFYTTQAELRQKVADKITTSLTQCGVGVTRKLVNPGELFAPGPEGPLFGRNFDLAEFYWEAGSNQTCSLFTTAQIPNATNAWLGTNITGYSNPEFDAACADAVWARPDQADYTAKIQAAEQLFVKELPVVPLFYQLKIAISRPDLCGLNLDVSSRSLFSNLESLDYGSDCK